MKRKNALLITLVSSISIVLVACSGGSNQSSASTGADTSSVSQGNTDLSEVNKLLVGSLKLQDTDLVITADEATTLLPLWQAYRSLSSSQTAAEAEVEALLKQIQSSMTAEQMQKIEGMNLTTADLMSLMQSMGGGFGPQGTPNPQGTPGYDIPPDAIFQPGDGPPEGFSGSGNGGSSGGSRPNPPSGGGFIVGGGPSGDAGSATGLGNGPVTQDTPDPSMQATAQARFSTQASRVNTILLDVLINKLQTLTSQ